VLPYNVEEIMVLGSPYINPDSGVRQSFLMNSITNTWATISDMDLMCAEVYYGQMIVGTRDGFVAQLFYGYNDRTSADGTDLGTEVTGRYQTAFNDLGDPTMNKRLLRTRLYGIADGIPSMIVKFVEEYDLTTRLSTASPLSILPAIWDLSTWDNSTWAANQASLRKWIGICGFGRKLSMLLAIRGQGRTVLSDYEILYETGINL
jgi:hypothetical protein